MRTVDHLRDADLAHVWARMAGGLSLADAAYGCRLHPAELDQALWGWRARRTRSREIDQPQPNRLKARRYRAPVD